MHLIRLSEHLQAKLIHRGVLYLTNICALCEIISVPDATLNLTRHLLEYPVAVLMAQSY